MGHYHGKTPQDGPNSGWGAALLWLAMQVGAFALVLWIWHSWGLLNWLHWPEFSWFAGR